MLIRPRDGDPSIPAGRVRQDRALVLADRAAGDPDRNLTHFRESLVEHAPLRPEQIYAMPVESPDLEAAATRYAATLAEIAGSPPVLDLVHLQLGPRGHTASLVPGDPVLEITDADVAFNRSLSREAPGSLRSFLVITVLAIHCCIA
jgi:6-phosphogluconolactonase/glucosamine-6-phosphate isomerase/deaminase